jgi:DNA-binding transcriptional LysR family regulator
MGREHMGGAETDWSGLALFVQVADAGSFAAVARARAVQRSSISRGIAALEDAIGVQLFARTTRQVALTTAGAALLARVRPLLAALHAAVRDVPEREEAPSGLVRLTAPSDIAATILPDMLAGFLARYPHVRVQLHASNRAVDLVGEGFDAAVRASPAKRGDSSLITRRLLPAEMQLFASPVYLAAHGTPRKPEDLVTHAWLSLRGAPPPSPLPRLKHEPRVSGDDMSFLHGAAIAGLGIALLPTFLVRDDVTRGRLVRLLPKVPLTSFGALYFAHPAAQRPPRKVTALRDYLVDAFARLGQTST